MKVTEELLYLQSLKGQTGGTDLFVSVCAVVDDMKLAWSTVSGMITDGVPAMVGTKWIVHIDLQQSLKKEIIPSNSTV